jgi:hypothetical protein
MDNVDTNSLDSNTEGSQEDLFNSKMKRKLDDIKNKKPCCYGFRRWCGWIVSREKREVKLNGSSTPRGFMTNKLNNTKYNLLSFIPVVLFN